MNNTPNATHCDAHHGGYFSPALADGGFQRLPRVIFLLARCVSHERRDFFA